MHKTVNVFLIIFRPLNLQLQELKILKYKQFIELYLYNKNIISYELKLIKMCAELASLNDCAVTFLSRAAVNLCWNYYNAITSK